MISNQLTSIELCAGAGGQAIGIENAGFSHQAVVEIDTHCQKTLQLNRPQWNIIENEQSDLWNFSAHNYKNVDLLAGGLPCPPFSIAGKQLGEKDERNLFPPALRIIEECGINRGCIAIKSSGRLFHKKVYIAARCGDIAADMFF